MSYPDDFEDDDESWDDDDLEDDEVNFFPSMPWINENIGSMMEAQLTRPTEPDECRQCGKRDEAIRSKEIPEKFCSDTCKEKWHQLLELRIAQGRHDLRTRGYD